MYPSPDLSKLRMNPGRNLTLHPGLIPSLKLSQDSSLKSSLGSNLKAVVINQNGRYLHPCIISNVKQRSYTEFPSCPDQFWVGAITEVKNIPHHRSPIPRAREGFRHIMDSLTEFQVDVLLYQLAIAQDGQYREAMTGTKPQYPIVTLTDLDFRYQSTAISQDTPAQSETASSGGQPEPSRVNSVAKRLVSFYTDRASGKSGACGHRKLAVSGLGKLSTPKGGHQSGSIPLRPYEKQH
ncbi:uncharacterized protein ATNIH1004_011465 [Aspergillus tanneri]|uniref:Uncharacterized protein n=1 Tax=Aspergillus tanneri TaxID=1220188 RepID=A0A5M9MAQ2_9EURO|nr:uncharacterized protein ATNIH1004_011465 [Aspergillus tanneri]KAA8642520.1 hypothetical protein ATNIH1004_011465 [Aspergillus tanneri]